MLGERRRSYECTGLIGLTSGTLKEARASVCTFGERFMLSNLTFPLKNKFYLVIYLKILAACGMWNLCSPTRD